MGTPPSSRSHASLARIAPSLVHELSTPLQYVTDHTLMVGDALRAAQALLAEYRAHRHELSSEVAARLEARELALDLPYLEAHAAESIQTTEGGLKTIATLVAALRDVAISPTCAALPLDLNAVVRSTLLVSRSDYKRFGKLELDLQAKAPLSGLRGDVIVILLLRLVAEAAASLEAARRTSETGFIRARAWSDEKAAHLEVEDNGAGAPGDDFEAELQALLADLGTARVVTPAEGVTRVQVELPYREEMR